MRILHTSDWHIGRQFHNVSLLDDQAHVLERLVGIVKEQLVDVVVIAGDIYDRSVPPADAVSLLNKTLKTLCLDMAVPVVMISGNHDGAERLGFGAELLQNAGLYIISDLEKYAEPVAVDTQKGQLTFYGIPYCSPEEVRHRFDVDVKTFDDAHSYLVNNITQKMNPEKRNILLSHCFVGGSQESESERPLSIGGAETVSWQPMQAFDYVALGHLHAPQRCGQDHIRYSGSLLQYSFSEVNQHKGVTLVEIETGLAPMPAQITQIPLIPKHSMRIIEGEYDDILKQAFEDDKRDDYLLVRLSDKTAILDAVGKLRQVYPNLLHLEKPGMNGGSEAATLAREQLQRSEKEMFVDFFIQTQGAPLSQEQDIALVNVIDEIHNAEKKA